MNTCLNGISCTMQAPTVAFTKVKGRCEVGGEPDRKTKAE